MVPGAKRPILCEEETERRVPTEEETADEAPGLTPGLFGDPEVSAIVAISELERASPHEEQNLILSWTSLEHDGQRMVHYQHETGTHTITGLPFIHHFPCSFRFNSSNQFSTR